MASLCLPPLQKPPFVASPILCCRRRSATTQSNWGRTVPSRAREFTGCSVNVWNVWRISKRTELIASKDRFTKRANEFTVRFLDGARHKSSAAPLAWETIGLETVFWYNHGFESSLRPTRSHNIGNRNTLRTVAVRRCRGLPRTSALTDGVVDRLKTKSLLICTRSQRDHRKGDLTIEGAGRKSTTRSLVLFRKRFPGALHQLSEF